MVLGFAPFTVQIMIIAIASLIGGVIAAVYFQLIHRRDTRHDEAMAAKKRTNKMEEHEIERMEEQRKIAQAEAKEAENNRKKVEAEADRERYKHDREKFHAEQEGEVTWISDEDSRMVRPADGQSVTTTPGMGNTSPIED